MKPENRLSLRASDFDNYSEALSESRLRLALPETGLSRDRKLSWDR
jgi:hypothetical protein